MAVVNLNEHLDWTISFPTDIQLRAAIETLLEIGTCFAVIGGEREIRTTRRGAEALSNTLKRRHRQ